MWGPVYIKHQSQCCDNALMMLTILSSLKIMESLQNVVAIHSGATPLFSRRSVSLALSQRWCWSLVWTGPNWSPVERFSTRATSSTPRTCRSTRRRRSSGCTPTPTFPRTRQRRATSSTASSSLRWVSATFTWPCPWPSWWPRYFEKYYHC